MSIIRVAFALALTIAAYSSAAAQSILFETNLGRALRQAIEATAGGVRVRPANRRCVGCEERPGAVHLIADSPLLTDAWIAGHEYHGTDPAYGDNKVVADFWYDAIHRRIFSRSGVFHDVDDPADVRLGRAPGPLPERAGLRHAARRRRHRRAGRFRQMDARWLQLVLRGDAGYRARRSDRLSRARDRDGPRRHHPDRVAIRSRRSRAPRAAASVRSARDRIRDPDG